MSDTNSIPESELLNMIRVYDISPRVRALFVVLAISMGALIAIAVSWGQKNPPVLLLAYGSLLASLTALFKDAIGDWIWGANLSVTYLPTADYCERVLAQSANRQSTAYYFRLLVQNTGHRRAENVEVLATSLFKVDDFGKRERKHRYLMNLVWTHRTYSILEGISPQMERFCDIGFYSCDFFDLGPQVAIGNSDDRRPLQPMFMIAVETNPNHLPHLLLKGKYELDLQISASNCRPLRRTLSIEISGKWLDQPNCIMNEDVIIQLKQDNNWCQPSCRQDVGTRTHENGADRLSASIHPSRGLTPK